MPQTTAILPQATTMPCQPCAAAIAPTAEVISPAEAQYWLDWANKAPSLLRSKAVEAIDKSDFYLKLGAISGVTLGAISGIASFTKHVKGNWRWVTGLGSLAALAFGGISWATQSKTGDAKNQIFQYAAALEQSPALKQQLANWFSASITANMAQAGIEKAVMEQSLAFATQPMRTNNLLAGLQPAGIAGR